MEEVKQRVDLTVETQKREEEPFSELWEEIRTKEEHPSRRSYHTGCSWNNSMLIVGGQDLREGPQGGLWVFHPRSTSWEEEGWHKVVDLPFLNGIYRLTSVVKDDSLYLFGGTDGDVEFNKVLLLNLTDNTVEEILPSDPNCPPPLDSHSANLFEDSAGSWMLVFGGFMRGVRSSNVYGFNLNNHTWRKIQTNDGPVARSNHSAVVYNECLYVFGGSDEEGVKLNDLWKLDLNTFRWEQVQCKGKIPSGRSGHSAVAYKDVMIVFGGMKDITKETNEMFSYHFGNNTWTMFQYETQVKDPVSAEQLEEYKKSKISPVRKNGSKDPSPNKSPTRSLNKSPTRSPTKLPSPERNVRKKRTLYEGPPSPLVGRVKGRVPHPRDGHSAVLIAESMYIFGGDRHQMPFNDLYAYQLQETTVKTPIRQ